MLDKIRNFLLKRSQNTLLQKIISFKNRPKTEEVIYADSSKRKDTCDYIQDNRIDDEI